MTNKTLQGEIQLTKQDGMATITFFHPSHNSLPGRLLAELKTTITAAGEDDEVKVIILKSAGDRTFCAGASFDELIAIDNMEQGKQFFMGFANVINAIRKCPKIVIGRIQGKAVGGGVGVASAVDYCMATKFAAIRLSELAIGIGPFVIGPAVERKLGKTGFSQMAITPKQWKSAEWAKAHGLYTEVFDTNDAMDQAIQELAQELTQYNPEALRLLKQVFWEGTSDWDELLEKRAAMSGELVLSDFTKRAIEAFKQK